MKTQITDAAVHAAAKALAEQDGHPGEDRFYLDMAFYTLCEQEDCENGVDPL